MNKDLYNCGVCYQKYNLSTLRPMSLPQCGHTLCEICVKAILEGEDGENQAKCPFDRKEFLLDPNGDGDYLQPQISMFAFKSLEKISQHQYCEDHSKRKKYFCKIDNERICSDCYFLGSHKNHEIERLDIVKNLFEEKSESLKNSLKDWDMHLGKIKEVLEKRKFETLEIVESVFNKQEMILKKQKQDLKFQVFAGYEQEKARIDSEFNKKSPFHNNLTKKINEYNDLNHPNLSRLMDEDIQDIISKYDTSMYEKNFLNFQQDSEKSKMFFSKALKSHMKKIASLGLPNLDIMIKREDAEGSENNDGVDLPTMNLSLIAPSYRIPSYLTIENLDDTLNITINSTLNEDFFIDLDSWRGVDAVKVTLCCVTLNTNEIMILNHILKNIDKKHELILRCRSLNTDNLSQQEITSKLREIFKILFFNSKNLSSVDVEWDSQNSSEILMKFINTEVFPKAFSLTSLKIHLPEIAYSQFEEFLKSLSPVQERLEIFEFITALNINNQTRLNRRLAMPKLKEFVFKIKCLKCNDIIDGEDFDTFFEESLKSMKLLKKLAFYLKARSETNLVKIFQIIQNMPRMKNLEAIVRDSLIYLDQEQIFKKIGTLISDSLSRMGNLQALSLGTALSSPIRILEQKKFKNSFRILKIFLVNPIILI